MTVRELAGLIHCEPREMVLLWNGITKEFDHTDKFELDAFGRYEVDRVNFIAYLDHGEVNQHIELEIGMAPVIGKETTA